MNSTNFSNILEKYVNFSITKVKFINKKTWCQNFLFEKETFFFLLQKGEIWGNSLKLVACQNW
jgi:hypothetical protein